MAPSRMLCVVLLLALVPQASQTTTVDQDDAVGHVSSFRGNNQLGSILPGSLPANAISPDLESYRFSSVPASFVCVFALMGIVVYVMEGATKDSLLTAAKRHRIAEIVKRQRVRDYHGDDDGEFELDLEDSSSNHQMAGNNHDDDEVSSDTEYSSLLLTPREEAKTELEEDRVNPAG